MRPKLSPDATTNCPCALERLQSHAVISVPSACGGQMPDVTHESGEVCVAHLTSLSRDAAGMCMPVSASKKHSSCAPQLDMRYCDDAEKSKCVMKELCCEIMDESV